MGLVMYVKPGCPYCQQARDYYNEHGVEFIEYDAQNDRARRKEMFAFSAIRRHAHPRMMTGTAQIAPHRAAPPRTKARR